MKNRLKITNVLIPGAISIAIPVTSAFFFGAEVAADHLATWSGGTSQWSCVDGDGPETVHLWDEHPG